MTHFIRALALAALALAAASGWAQKPSGIGVVLLHGLNGSPMSMSTLSYELRERGHLVSAPELPWSAMRNHDVTTEAALREIAREMDDLRKNAALELFDPVAQRTYPIFTTPDAFVSWFGPESPLQPEPLLGGLPPGLPVLLVVATRDLDSLRAMKQSVYGRLPAHPAKRLYEPDANHIGAVNASAAEVMRWIGATLPRR